MKISARNQLRGTVTDITKGGTTSHVRLDVGGGAVITASITNEAVDELKLKKGQKGPCDRQGVGRHDRRRLRRR